jgi:hypothetical protein
MRRHEPCSRRISDTRIGSLRYDNAQPIIRCGEPVEYQLSEFWPAIGQKPFGGAISGFKLRDGGIVPVICPTRQVFSRAKHRCRRQLVSLHGVVFDILVGARHRCRVCARRRPVTRDGALAKSGAGLALSRIAPSGGASAPSRGSIRATQRASVTSSS